MVWVESGLHDRPERLQAALERPDRAARRGRPHGQCRERSFGPSRTRAGRGAPGRGARRSRSRRCFSRSASAATRLKGLSARHMSLVFPRVDDCISLLLNRGCVREEIPRNPRHYYLTRGWFSHESSLKQAFDDWDERYGPERAAKLRETMFAGYERVNLIDTQAYDVDECLDQSRDVSPTTSSLEHGIVAGVGPTARAAVQRREGQRDRRRASGGGHRFQSPVRRTEHSRERLEREADVETRVAARPARSSSEAAVPPC